MIAAVLVSPALDVPRLEGCGGYVSTSGPLPSRSAGRVQTSSAHRRCNRAQRSASPPTRACPRRRRGASPRQGHERRGRSRGASTSHARSGQAKVEGRGAPSQRSRRQQASRTGSRHRSRQRAELRAPVGRRSASRPARQPPSMVIDGLDHHRARGLGLSRRIDTGRSHTVTTPDVSQDQLCDVPSTAMGLRQGCGAGARYP